MPSATLLIVFGLLCVGFEPVRADNPVIYPQARYRQHFPGPPPSPVPLAKWGPPYPYGWFGVWRGQRSLSGSQSNYRSTWREMQFGN